MTSEAALDSVSPSPAMRQDRSRSSFGRRDLLWLLLPIGFFSAMVLFYSFRFVFEFDPDEGINAIKALLALRGFPLYTQVWSDQPPVFTFLLAAWFRLFGLKVVAGRLLVLVFSTLLAAAVIHHLQRWWGVLAAVCGFLLLILLPQYARLSVSIMIGLPAIACGFFSIWALSIWHDQRRPIWLVVSSVFLGLAIFTKGFMLILLPCVAVGIALTLRQSPTPRFIWTSLAAWGIPLAAIGLGMLFLIRPENLGQLADVHVAAQVNPAFQTSVILPTINTYLSRSIPLLILAALGAYQTVRTRSWVGLYLVGWALLAYFALLLNRPTWPHHELLVTVPAAILAGVGAAAALREVWQRLRKRTPQSMPLGPALIGVVALVALVITRLPDFLSEFNLRLPNLASPSAASSAESLAERQIVALMADHADDTDWVYAENPMFAFQAGLPVPPPLAVLSQKRLQTGALSEAQVLEVLEAYKPGLVLESRFFLRAAEEYMRPRNFTRIDSTLKYRLYLRKDPS